MESPPRYVALRDLFLQQGNDVKTTPANRQHSTSYHIPFACNSAVDRRYVYRSIESHDLTGNYSDTNWDVVLISYAGGSDRERRITTEECEEITNRNPIARRLEYSDFEANDSFRDDFCFDREYFGRTSFKREPDDRGKWSFFPY